MSGEAELAVAIVEDDSALRQGLVFLIDGTPGYRCVGAYDSIEAALRGRWPTSPEVLLLDIHLPGILGSRGVRSMLELFEGAAVLMLSVHADEDLVFESLCNGACGYLLKTTPPARLLEAIAEARSGGSPMSPEIARKVVRLFREIRPAPRSLDDPSPALTPQEVRLLQLLADGHSYQSAAGQLIVSINTVRNYVRSVYEKLHVHSKSEAVSKALRARLI